MSTNKNLTITAGKFKAQCLQIVNEVNEKHIGYVITKHGKPIARIVPIDETPADYFGCLQNAISIKDNLLAPINDEWDAEK